MSDATKHTPAVALVIMAKIPLEGLAKTRLIPALGAQGAAKLAHQLLEHAMLQAHESAVSHVTLCLTPSWDDARCPDSLRQSCERYGFEPKTQIEGDLGERMLHAMQEAFTGANNRDKTAALQGVMVMGTDAPALDATLIRQAAQALLRTDVVMVPAWDGGYTLLGMRTPAPQLFLNMTWSTDQVLQETLERARHAQLSVTLMPAISDIDTAEDLQYLERRFATRFHPIANQ